MLNLTDFGGNRQMPGLALKVRKKGTPERVPESMLEEFQV